jgi:hypothetical protein
VKKRLQEQLDKMARFSPIMRFILIDPEERKFTAERWSYLGDIDDLDRYRGVRKVGKIGSAG